MRHLDFRIGCMFLKVAETSVHRSPVFSDAPDVFVWPARVTTTLRPRSRILASSMHPNAKLRPRPARGQNCVIY